MTISKTEISASPDELTFITEQELSDLLKRTKAAIRADRQKGRGIPFVKIGSQVRYRLSDVKRHLDGCLRTSTVDRGDAL